MGRGSSMGMSSATKREIEVLKLSIEERFWLRVWKCDHKQPCKTCCWPWQKGINLETPYVTTWWTHPYFADSRLLPRSNMPASRVAYVLTHKTLLLFPRLWVCHQCDFAPCCNPSHLCLGMPIDNLHD